jgi:two-component system, response regulator
MKTKLLHKILIVDDDPNDTFLTKRALSKSGFEVEVETAVGGECAIELLRNKDDIPSLILLDLKMPGMSGVDTLRQIRADSRLRNVRVIIVTNSLLESDKEESYAAGADGFLNKAFDRDQVGGDLESILERWLKE